MACRYVYYYGCTDMGNMIIESVIMLGLLAFLAVDILYGARVERVNYNFMDVKNAKAMRGFWCLVIALVHVPQMYGNRIQDLIGSFAYIGVTFFFMTSGFGLTIVQDINHKNIKFFWRKRLPKIIIVSWINNAFFCIINHVFFRKPIHIFEVIALDLWVIWLLTCYFYFWLFSILFKGNRLYKVLLCLIIMIGSATMYMLKRNGIIPNTVWATEVYGFIWGILLASCKNDFIKWSTKKWNFKLCMSCLCSLILGVDYLLFKYIPVIGDYILKILLGLAITVFVLVLNTRIDLGNKLNLFLGTMSFEIYLVHGKVFELFENLFVWKEPSVFILCSIMATMVTSWGIYIISEKLVSIVKRRLLK